jgi:hypothetical protein
MSQEKGERVRWWGRKKEENRSFLECTGVYYLLK